MGTRAVGEVRGADGSHWMRRREGASRSQLEDGTGSLRRAELWRSSAAHWLLECYPSLGSLDGVELEQQPGETVVVPHGWWHAVVNLELSVAVTANFVHAGNAGATADALRQP